MLTNRSFWQVLASLVKNFLLLDLGLTMAMPTIIIPALSGKNIEINPNETIHITPEEASWLGIHTNSSPIANQLFIMKIL